MSQLEEDEGGDAPDEAYGADETPVLRRGARVREADVFRAADQLLLAGHRPSVERIKLSVGRGSPNTIAHFLDRWWSALGARLRDLPGQELPAVPHDVATAMHTLWMQAIDHARTLLQETLAEQSAVLLTERAAIEQRGAALAREHDDFHRERTALQQTVTMAQAQLEAAHERHRLDTARVAESDQALARAQTQLDALRSEAQGSSAKLEAALQQHQFDVRTLNERNEATERHWLKAVDEARQALLTEKKNALAAERQHSTDASQHIEELRDASLKLIALRTELERLHERYAEAKAQIAKFEKITAEQGLRADRAVQTLQESQQQSTRQIEALQQQLREALEQLKQASARNEQRPRASGAASQRGKDPRPSGR